MLTTTRNNEPLSETDVGDSAYAAFVPATTLVPSRRHWYQSGASPEAVTLKLAADGETFVLNGTKSSFVSNGGIADVYTLFERTGEAPGEKGLSAFVVTPDLPGFEVVEGDIVPKRDAGPKLDPHLQETVDFVIDDQQPDLPLVHVALS